MIDNSFAIFCLVVLALLVVGLMVETYRDCRLLKGGSLRACLPPMGDRPIVPRLARFR